ncbi:MAG: hypothetical protein ACLT1W_01180 [Alistipes onderdonkii]
MILTSACTSAVSTSCPSTSILSSNMKVVDERHTTHSIAVWGSLPPRPMTLMKESAHERPFLGSFSSAGIRVSCSFTTSGWCWIAL